VAVLIHDGSKSTHSKREAFARPRVEPTDLMSWREVFESLWRSTGRRRPLRSEMGQVSIFLALIFQVLFVFFAMVINMGLFVHDKINLQNAVDLGAFYAAGKQAELMNEIAHINFQIRQDYKLLAFRYHVLGTLGRDGGPGGTMRPPARSTGALQDVMQNHSVTASGPIPISCIAHPYWWEFASLTVDGNEHYCWQPTNGYSAPPVAINATGGAPDTAALNAAIQQNAMAAYAQYIASCNSASPLNWSYLANILGMYKFSVATRKQTIWSLRSNLVSGDIRDRDNQTIREGVRKTVLKNLTEASRNSQASVDFINGLSQGDCAGGARPGENTIPEILTTQLLYFMRTWESGGCNFAIAAQSQWASLTSGDQQQQINALDPTGILRAVVAGEPNQQDPFHSSLGFEKNPWCMAWVGVKARASPRKPFAPFGQPIGIEARAFAQPFGGRIGPWYGNRWSSSDLISSSDPSSRTDRLTSPRQLPGAGLPGSASFDYIPNFSRFPGDQLGMQSQLAQGLGRVFLRSLAVPQPVPGGGTANPQRPANRLMNAWFGGFYNVASTGDPIAYDYITPSMVSNNVLAGLRNLEMAVVAPNLFDVAYYSIDPQGTTTFANPLRQNSGRVTLAPTGAIVAGDLGSHAGTSLANINLEAQIEAANGSQPAFDPQLMPQVHWMIRDWRNLLTMWAPHRATNFAFPTERFGQCAQAALPDSPIPGKCAIGGRSGYSVRLISREHLNGKWKVGGADTTEADLKNPPSQLGDW